MGFNPFTEKGQTFNRTPAGMEVYQQPGYQYVDVELEHSKHIVGVCQGYTPPTISGIDYGRNAPFNFLDLVCVYAIQNSEEVGNYRTFKKPHKTTYTIHKEKIVSILVLDKKQTRAHLQTAYGYDPEHPSGYEPASTYNDSMCLEW